VIDDLDLMPDDHGLVAAEYVIGLLTWEEMREVEARAIGSPMLAASILEWQAWLHPLSDAVAPVAPPDEVWQRLEATLGFVHVAQPAPTRMPTRIWWLWASAPAWRSAMVGAVCTALVGGAVVGVKQWTSSSEVAALISLDGEKTDYKVEMTPSGFATVVAVDPNLPADATLQLWTLDSTATPVSLGLLPPKGRLKISRQLVPGAKLLISREPKGGSPAAGPTGPVIYNAPLLRG